MDANNLLEISLTDVLSVIRPLRDDWVVRSQIIEDLRVLVLSLESLRGAVVEPFGSFVSNLFTRQGDLDISIDLPYNSYIASSGKRHKQALLGEVLKALRRRGGVRRLQFISNARVPILKFESDRGISCDISIDNFQGQMKSKLLFWLTRIDERFHDMILIVKEWAKAHSINDSKTGTLNSYSLCLLVILHFQTCAPAIFPPLKDIYPGNIIDDLKGVRADAERRIEETCIANIAKFNSDKHRVINRSSLSELFISFLAKFSDISLKASELGICTYMGQWQDIGSNMRWLPKTYALLIEDPFEQPENTARAVSTANLKRISQAFGTTYSRLTAATHVDRNSLLATLVKPQTFQYITGTPLRSPILNNGRLFNHAKPRPDNSSANAATHPRPIRAVSPQVQQQQKKNTRTSGKATTQRSTQPNQMLGTRQPYQIHGTNQPYQMQGTSQPYQMQGTAHPNQMQSQWQRTIQMQSQVHRTNQMQSQLQRTQMQNPLQRTQPNQMQSQMHRMTQPNQTQKMAQMQSQIQRNTQPNQSRKLQAWRQKSDTEAKNDG